MPIRMRQLIKQSKKGQRIELRLPCSVRTYRVDEFDAYTAKVYCPTTGQRVTIELDQFVFEQRDK